MLTLHLARADEGISCCLGGTVKMANDVAGHLLSSQQQERASDDVRSRPRLTPAPRPPQSRLVVILGSLTTARSWPVRPSRQNPRQGHARGRWQIARQTHVSADLGSVRIDLTDAMFDDHVTDLHVYSGWGSITIIVPRGVAVQITHHKGRVDARLEPPVPGLPLIRLDVTTNIGTVHLRHPGAPSRTRPWLQFKRR